MSRFPSRLLALLGPPVVPLLALVTAACQRIPDELLADEEHGNAAVVPVPPPVFRCVPGSENECEASEKCSATFNANGQTIYACVLDDGALAPYGLCRPDRAGAQDACPAGYLCILAAADADEGRCLALCAKLADCPGGFCIPDTIDKLQVCADECDPLAAGCAHGLHCVQQQRQFACMYPAGSYLGGPSEACNPAADEGCQPGLVCVSTHTLLGCSDASCCTSACDLREASGCVPPNICREATLSPTPAFDHVGICVTPG
ncbi:MAG: hypothetical protein V3V08_09660 [Nannocystaceae bacterium]